MKKRLLVLFFACLGLLVFVFIPKADAETSYDATVDNFFHGSLDVVDANCHSHHLSFADTGGLSWRAFNAWGAHHYNIHVVAHTSGSGLEIADVIYPRDGMSTITRCATEEQSFATHVDGRIVSWSEGNAVGSFTLLTLNGATRDFGFLAGKEPSINGQRVACVNSSDPVIACDSLKAVITLGRTKVRVYYKVIESPDGPSDAVVRIQTL